MSTSATCYKIECSAANMSPNKAYMIRRFDSYNPLCGRMSKLSKGGCNLLERTSIEERAPVKHVKGTAFTKSCFRVFFAAEVALAVLGHTLLLDPGNREKFTSRHVRRYLSQLHTHTPTHTHTHTHTRSIVA